MKRFSFLSVGTLALFFLLNMLTTPTPLADSGANHQVRNTHFGVSGGNVKDISRRFCCSGTLGSLVQANGVQYILSNNHVLGLAGQAQPGDDISQPGLVDTNCRAATIVANFTVAPPLSSGVDAAIAALQSGQMDATGFIEDIGTISSIPKTPIIGLSVEKSGRTTGLTTGTISSINTTVSVQYPTQCGGHKGPVFTFPNQVVVNSSSFSAGGDSGSLIVTNDITCHQPVALLFAGSSTSTIGNPIGQVLTQLSNSLGPTVSFVGTACGTSATTSAVLDNELPQQLVDHATFIKERNEDRLRAKGSVIGVGISAAEDNPGEAVIVVYVDQTTGKTPKLPKTVEGVRVKTVYTDPFIAY